MPTRQMHEEDNYLASVSDLMVGLLFVFIIMLMAFALNLRTAEEQATRTREELETARAAAAEERDELAGERDEILQRHEALSLVSARLVELEAQRAQLLQTVTAELGQRDVPVTLDAANGVLRLPESLLFDSGAAELRPEGEHALSVVAETLAATLPCYSHSPSGTGACPQPPQPLLEAVLIEGHTDDVPIRSSQFADNWTLSAARGVNTYKALTGHAPELSSLQNARGEALLGVAGYEARRPVAPGNTPEERRLNRRIDLRFLVAAPGDSELAAIIRRLGAKETP
jgi:chemotaxis protein MotB